MGEGLKTLKNIDMGSHTRNVRLASIWYILKSIGMSKYIIASDFLGCFRIYIIYVIFTSCDIYIINAAEIRPE